MTGIAAPPRTRANDTRGRFIGWVKSMRHVGPRTCTCVISEVTIDRGRDPGPDTVTVDEDTLHRVLAERFRAAYRAGYAAAEQGRPRGDAEDAEVEAVFAAAALQLAEHDARHGR